MTIKNVIIDPAATCGKTAIIKSVRPRYRYIDGRRTDVQEGYSIACVLPERGYEELSVSVPSIPAELEGCTGNPCVTFDGLTLSVYGRPDDLRLSAKAAAVHMVDGKAKA